MAEKKEAEYSSNKFIFSTADTCEFFEITRTTLSEWQKKGAPQISRGKWNIKEVAKWKNGGKGAASPESRKLKAEADLKEAKAAQEKIKLDVTKGKFVSAQEVQAEITKLMGNLKKSLLAISHNVATNLATLDVNAAEIAKNEVDERIKEALKEMSKGGVYRERKARKTAKK